MKVSRKMESLAVVGYVGTHIRPRESFIGFRLVSSSLIKLINQLYAACLSVKLTGAPLIKKFPDVYRP
jgi:hypothetical protein